MVNSYCECLLGWLTEGWGDCRFKSYFNVGVIGEDELSSRPTVIDFHLFDDTGRQNMFSGFMWTFYGKAKPVYNELFHCAFQDISPLTMKSLPL